ncbi:MAG: Xaa-Pro aminopeptidase [Pseudomonadota bacterium]
MKQTELKRRRRQLMNSMGEGGIAILPAAPEHIRNRDVYHDYRQDSDFLYLTGFSEPESVAVLIPGREQGEFILFCRERDPEKETWDGLRAGQEGAVNEYGADDAFPITDIDDILPGLMENRERVYYTMGRNPVFDKHMMDWLNRVRSGARRGVRAPGEFIDLDHQLHEYRLFKSRGELSAMRKAAKVAASGHKRAMAACRPGVREYQIEAELLYEFRRNNMTTAYPSIVGGGRNGCILHYIDNRDELHDGDLLLIDAGAEYQGYASDITRTFPVNGQFTPAQREVYEIVLEAQLAAIEKTVPGNNWDDPHQAALKVLVGGLVSLGLLQGKVSDLIESGDYRRFYMHRTGHWLGMDVHDVGDYKVDENWRLLEPGMVTTVEPGLYIAAADDIPERFHNIGIRIEDDVAVTKDGYEVLSRDVPKDVESIEALVGTGV